MKIKNKKRLLVWLTAITLSVALTVGGCAIYVLDYYRADNEAIKTFAIGNSVEKTEICKGMLSYSNKNNENGLIFYPGGKVECTAYEPLMYSLASKGIFCVLVEMPFNLAVLDMNAADGIIERYPDVKNWYIGGHSLGGSMAASYIAKNADDFCGLILLGSYSTADLSEKGLKALSIYGSEDGVMNREKYDKYKCNLPSDMTEIEMDGACHAYFGMYGEQKGDGNPTLTPRKQITITADLIEKFVTKGEK